MIKTLLISAFLFFINFTQATNTTIVKHYSAENGLTHNTVNCAIKDKDGFMWFGTWYGLSCFDGVKFTKYNVRNNLSIDIPPRKIQTIIEGNHHTLWVKTIDHKLYLFDKKKECFISVLNVLKKYPTVSSQIIKIEQTKEGAVLMLTQNKDLLIGDVNLQKELDIRVLYDSQTQRREKNIRTNVLFEDKEYIGWIGADYALLWCLKGTVFARKNADYITRSITGNQSVKFTHAYSTNNELWLGDEEGNIFWIQLYDGKAQKRSIPGIKGSIENIVSDDLNNMYISVKNKGIFEYNKKTDSFAMVVAFEESESVKASFVDSYNKVWFETNNSSLIGWDVVEKKSRRFNLNSGNINESIKMCDGKEYGMFFLTTNGDIFVYHRDEDQLKGLAGDIQNNYNIMDQKFYNMLLDDDGILWLSTVNNGIFRLSFPPKQFNMVELEGKPITKLPNVKSLFKARNGDVWVGYRSGEVILLDHQLKIKKVFDKNNYCIGPVYHIMEDRKGNLWFSTKGNGLVRAIVDKRSPNGYQFTRFKYDANDPFSISGDYVYYTLQDSKNNIWVALFGGGLNLISETEGEIRFLHKYNTFKNYPQYSLYMEVRNIVEAEDGRIWAGTTDGLFSFENNFQEPENILFETYRNENSVNNVTDNDIYVLYKDSSSNIWFSVFGGGLSLLKNYDELNKKPVIETYRLKEGLSSDVTLSIHEDEQNNLWLAMENSLCCFSKQHKVFQSFDQYDGFPALKMEEVCVTKADTRLLFGHRNGIISFHPENIHTVNKCYPTYIVGMKVSNKQLVVDDVDSLISESMRYVNEITLHYFQSMFDIEFATLNFYNQNRIDYKYILEGYEKEWHANGMNRNASYTNVPPGNYLFRVVTQDEANPTMKSEATLKITILSPWWKTPAAFVIYIVLTILLLFGIVQMILFFMKMKNDIYISQKLNELKIRFFTNISHELRTPLTLIKGPIQELKHMDMQSPKSTQYITLIEKNTDHMLQLVNHILDFRKIQNGKMKLHVSQCDLNELVCSVHKEFTVLAEEQEVSYNVEVSDEKILVWADAEKIKTVIRNILSNAFKFTSAGGEIYMSAGVCENSTKCFIKIEDSGIGIPQNKLGDIFNRFSQVENTKNNFYQGTGIGLALSKEIINMHQGDIFVESNIDIGSLFTIQLNMGKSHFEELDVEFYVGNEVDESCLNTPDTNHTEVSDLTKASDVPDNSLPVLLFVEDNKDLGNLLRLQLEDKYNVLLASNGIEGLKKIHLYHPDIVVTDLMMPEMDGIQMLKQIRADFQISHIPVIILTAKYGEQAKTNAISLGANAYITKPFSKEYLEARIDQLLTERKWFRDNIWQKSESMDKTPKDDFAQGIDQKEVAFLNKIHHIIEENMLNDDFNIDAIASIIGLSRSAFFKKLKGLTGLAPVELLRDIRLNKSIELIKTTDMTVSEIAYSVGFKDSGYYSKCFKKKYDQSPRDFMYENRKTVDYKIES